MPTASFRFHLTMDTLAVQLYISHYLGMFRTFTCESAPMARKQKEAQSGNCACIKILPAAMVMMVVIMMTAAAMMMRRAEKWVMMIRTMMVIIITSAASAAKCHENKNKNDE